MEVGEGVTSVRRSLTNQTKFYFWLPVPARQLRKKKKREVHLGRKNVSAESRTFNKN